MGGEIALLVLDILNFGVMPENLNLTHIALIPKVTSDDSHMCN
jgi:hypothetical protein